LLAVLIALGGYALAQEGATETGDGEAYATTPNTETAPKAALPDASNMSHWFILGSHLRPRNSSVEYVYDLNGCMHITNAGGGTRLQFPVLLPDGSTIKSMDIIYNDTSASNLTVFLSAYDPGVDDTDIILLKSTGDTGVGTASSSEISYSVDNSQEAYSVNYSWTDITDGTLQICGIRINYVDPFYTSLLPAALK
jgi:hypothetical protein